MNPDTLASQIIEAVGGKDNVREVFHCVTRLRFYLNDLSKADEERLKKTNGVLGVVNTTEQLQIIIGNEVDTVCNAVQAQLGPIDAKAKLDADVAKNKEEMKKYRIGGIFETISAIILPVIPAMAGTGILKGVVTIMTSYLGFASDDVLIQVLTMAADSVFYFLPFFLAWSSAKRFKTDIAMALVIAGILLYPTMTAGQSAGSDPMYLFGVLPIPFAKYSASSIPIILSVWVMSYVYKYVDKFIPKMLRLVFTPLVTVLIMAPVALVVTGPIANYLAQAIATLFTWLFTVSPLIAGAVIGATRSLLVFTGMHLSLGAVCLNNISVLGYDYILPVNTMGTMAIVGCCLGVWICAKKSENKEIGMSTFVSSFLGITEPGIYGVLMTFRTALIADIIAGGIAGAFVATIGCHAYAYVNSCILSLPVFVDENFVFMCIGMALATALGCGLTIFFGLDEGDGIKARLFSKKAEPAPAVEAAGAATPSVAVAGATNSVDVVASPLTGSVSPLSETPDAVFASGTLGKGVVIEPTEGVLRSPFDGTVTAVYPSKHAIGVTSDSGVECLIHIGIDTVNLGGKHFEMAVEQGQHVQAGDTLLTFDIDAIKAAGYSVVSPVIISNTASYLDVFPVNERGAVKAGDELIKTLK
ncbi:beta-glucoside-specific PTS transporter subunit IIABC [Enorma phocaeensis]|uniref:beta-glucoside-specific PTS transporter subunit IIABC n=1 Tax=Enorma phocaeensis TaxID=1871019 RepID=UPI0019592ADA|nr:beta-glucoside-specific PTS transporter subunit IIABC [Enorma phocaeensis]MBM6953899.1 PTS glucose transporter subunit IIA [Enorma phocaeensis]